MKNIDYKIDELKKAYKRGENITSLLKAKLNLSYNNPNIIELAYEIQSGSYIEDYKKNIVALEMYCDEICGVLEPYLHNCESLLDIGTGEMTTLSLILKKLKDSPNKIYACDISWSRIYLGLEFARQTISTEAKKIKAFMADIHDLPIKDKAIDITISSHALEPNGDSLNLLLEQIFRVTRKYAILFEPCYELNSPEGKDRMDRLGYIKNIASTVEKQGGKMIDIIPIQHSRNKLNPTACFLIEPPKGIYQCSDSNEDDIFSFPGTNEPLIKRNGYYLSTMHGISFPIIESIPALRKEAGIYTTAILS